MIGEVVKLDRKYPLVALEDGNVARCEESADLKKRGKTRAAIGDRVEAAIPEGHEFGVITSILPRKSSLVRKDPTDRTAAQVMAANFDQVVIVEPLDRANPKRIERELVLAHETGADVAVLLTKSDAVPESETARILSDIRAIAGKDVPVLGTSMFEPDEVLELKGQLFDRRTSILLGQSGAGKSTLINTLAEREVCQVGDVRETDGKGRHTTVSREILEIPAREGETPGRIVDMPGIRGLGLWDAREGIGMAFRDIEKLSEGCRFRDCKHVNEPGCAVLAAVQVGELAQARLDSYVSLKDELEQTDLRRRQSTWKNK